MRTFQRAALVAAVVAGLSTLGAGVGFADGNDGPYQVSAVASAQATAVVTWGAPHGERHSERGHKHEESKPEHKHHGSKPCHKHEESKPCHKHKEAKPCHKHHKCKHHHKPCKHHHKRAAERFSDAWVDVSASVA
ncbi:hypothetical protein [Streptomyces barringtoniae]|uniref:hypothetical protein n=1 Tax=Streptomyces barringtoniae TaxID=2892029 RepID=UPI001E5246B8|nr:hypothetical protein [Streptomyces barringtoniae]MCC5479464.1 hypothetical protein [Streptomyces barringtoniae]